ncbi:MAG: class I SAM-dependent methyltransferase [Bacilli bacterium]|nr:class I SAM-dependent methyltransferase [Bacilli bacterium]
MVKDTEKYYQEHAYDYIQQTMELDMSPFYAAFESRVKEGGVILDVGCGSGRDSLHFKERYQVYAIDTCPAFVEHAKELGVQADVLSVLDLDIKDKFDGIWACASLLHLKRNEIKKAFSILCDSLKKSGTLYASFKYGTYEGLRGGRHYTDFTEETIREVIDPRLTIEKLWITETVKPGVQERWVNLILSKKN